MDFPIENKVEKANIHQIDLMDYVHQGVIHEFDLKQALWQEAIIKEKEFRAFVKLFDWEQYRDQHVALYCSVDAIIPAWAFMVISTNLAAVNARVKQGTPEAVKADLFFENLNQMDVLSLADQRVMVKGCSNIPDPNKAYVTLTNLLIPHVKSLMFGEPCSAVPVYKKK